MTNNKTSHIKRFVIYGVLVAIYLLFEHNFLTDFQNNRNILLISKLLYLLILALCVWVVPLLFTKKQDENDLNYLKNKAWEDHKNRH